MTNPKSNSNKYFLTSADSSDINLASVIQYETADTVVAVFMESVVGSNGLIVPPDGYMQLVGLLGLSKMTCKILN